MSLHIQALREKEKGDWKKLSIEEKKQLYRASFRQTFSEMDAPTGEWKGIVGMSMLVITSGLWLYIYFKTFGTFSTKSATQTSAKYKLLVICPNRHRRIVNCDVIIFVAYPPLPETLTDPQRRLAQLERMKKLDMNPIEGPLRKYREN